VVENASPVVRMALHNPTLATEARIVQSTPGALAVQPTDRIPLPELEPRLQRRFVQLVLEHLGSAVAVAAGPRRLFGCSAAASAQGACRFFDNDSIDLRCLTLPVLRRAAFDLQESPCPFVLAIHDWSKLNFHHHSRKADQIDFGQTTDRGYELTSCLLVDADDGVPLAAAHLRLCTAREVFDSCQPAPARYVSHLDTLLKVFDHLRRAGLPRRLVHVIDCEGDSVGHLRLWCKKGHLVLVRTDGTRTVNWRGREYKMPDVVEQLQQDGAFGPAQAVRYHGRRAFQEVAQAEVLLCRPAYRNRKGRRKVLPGKPLAMRLVVTRVYDLEGVLVAQWCLLTNVPAQLSAELVALWYYWRWRIESYFKLLKAAGQQLEHWQQWDGQGIAMRLAVASMACLLAWRAARQGGEQGRSLREVLIGLSGRLLKHEQEATLPALLQGLRLLLAAVLLVLRLGWEQTLSLAALALPQLLPAHAQAEIERLGGGQSGNAPPPNLHPEPRLDHL
jgi:hypothetical protein